MFGKPVAGVLISVQLWPKSLERNTRLPGPANLKPDAVMITVPGAIGETATEVSGNPATRELPWASLGLISVNVGLAALEFLLTHACGPIAPLELVTTYATAGSVGATAIPLMSQNPAVHPPVRSVRRLARPNWADSRSLRCSSPPRPGTTPTDAWSR